MLQICSAELKFLDMIVNVKKFCCIRIGKGSDTMVENLATVSKIRKFHGVAIKMQFSREKGKIVWFVEHSIWQNWY